MKIAIGYKVVKGPWGGGNQFVISLIRALKTNGHQVVHELKDKDIDIIVIIDPRIRNPNIPFSTGSILRYLIFKNFSSIVLHRINECDERKKTKTMNYKLRLANFCADQTVVVGEWMKSLDIFHRSKKQDILTIKNGSNQTIFNPKGYKKWNNNSKFKIVTHHWSGNWMKGFDIYQKFDQMLNIKKISKLFEFTYVGNLPKGFSFKNAKYIKPLNGKSLAEELKKHHAYLTASINEPGGNHQNEAALCGLPLLYRDSGCLPEYCNGYGVSFNENNFEDKLFDLKKNYNLFANKMDTYPYNDIKTNNAYIELFHELISQKHKLIKKRNFFKSPVKFILNYIL